MEERKKKKKKEKKKKKKKMKTHHALPCMCLIFNKCILPPFCSHFAHTQSHCLVNSLYFLIALCLYNWLSFIL